MAQGRDSRGRYTSGDGDTLEGLAGEAQGAAGALDELADSAKKAQPALKATGDGAKKLGDDLDGAGEKAKKAADATNVFARAIGEAAGDALTEARQALTEWVRDLPEAAARAEAHAATLERLGASYGVVQQATNGAVSAEQAAAVQQRALQSGLRLSAQELAAVTSRAREFARSTGTDLNQALEQLTDQLVDPGEELRKFGVFLQTGMNAGDALRETLRQLQAQTAATATSEVSLSEAMEQARRATNEATDALAAQLAKELELKSFFTQLATWITDAKNATNGWDEAVTAVTGTLREMIGLRSQASAAAGQAGQSASGQFTGEAGALMQQARARGLNFRGFEIGHLGVDATPEQRNRVLALLRRAALGNLGGSFDGRGVSPQAALDAELSGLDAEVSQTRSDRERQQREAAAAAEAARRRELARRNRASQSPSNATPDGQLLTVGSSAVGSIFDALIARGGGLALRDDPSTDQGVMREMNAATLRQFVERRARELDRQRREREAALRGYDRQDLTDRVGGAAQGVDAAMADIRGRQAEAGPALPFSDGARARAQADQDRIRVLREQGAGLRELLDANRALEQQQRGAGATQAELNDIIRQRIGLQQALAQNSRDLADSQTTFGETMQGVGDKLVASLEGTTDAFAESVVAALEGSKAFGQSMEEMVRATLRALAKLAIVEALKEGAMAVAALATYRYDAAVQHGIAAGMWAGVGVVAGAGVAAMGSGAKPAAASGGGASASTATGGGRAARADDRASTGGPLTIVLNVSGAAFTDAGVQHAATAAVREAIGSGVLRREHLAPLLGD